MVEEDGCKLQGIDRLHYHCTQEEIDYILQRCAEKKAEKIDVIDLMGKDD